MALPTRFPRKQGPLPLGESYSGASNALRQVGAYHSPALQAQAERDYMQNGGNELQLQKMSHGFANDARIGLVGNNMKARSFLGADNPVGALADRAISGQSVAPASNFDPAVWGPGGRQYPTVTPAALGGGQQPLSVAPRYGQSGQQAAMSLQNAQQQASDFTNRGVDRIFATNGNPISPMGSSYTGPPAQGTPVAQSMDYGSGSTLIRTADGRTILAGRRIAPEQTTTAASDLTGVMRQNAGSVPQADFRRIQGEAAARTLSANKGRYAKVADQRSDARDRQIVTNAMRFGVRNPLAIQTAQKMGVRLPGMPRISGDAVAANSQPTTEQINASLTRAQQNPVYADIQPGFDPGAAQGSQWASMLQQPNVMKMQPSEVARVKNELRDAKKSKTYKSNTTDDEVVDAFLSGGPQGVANLIKSRQAAGQPYGVPNFNKGSNEVARGRIGM